MKADSSKVAAPCGLFREYRARHPSNIGETPPENAIARGHEIMAKTILAQSNRINSSLDPQGNQGQAKSLFLATASGYSGIVQLLLDHGFNVNARDDYDRTPLHVAAGHGHSGAVAVLLGHRYEATALHLAAKNGHTAILQELLTVPETDINRRDRSGATALWLATRRRHDYLAIQLLSQPDVDVNAIVHLHVLGRDRSTSLHHAVQGPSIPVLRSLIWTRQLDPNITDHQNRTALSWAVERGDLTAIDLLFTRSDIRVDPIGISEDPILWLAIKTGQVDVVRRLLQYPKVNINHGWGIYEPPLLFSVEQGHMEIALLLLAQGERLDVNRILRHHVEVNSIDNQGRTAFWWAASEGNCAMVLRLLADARIKVDIEDNAMGSPLIVARRWGHTDVVLQLQLPMGLYFEFS